MAITTEISGESGPIEKKGCPECRSTDLIYEARSDQLTCQKCSVVIEGDIKEELLEFYGTGNSLDYGQHQTNEFSTAATPSNVVTTISKKDKCPEKLKRVLKWNARNPWGITNIIIGTTEIKRLSELIALPICAKDYACVLYKKAFKKKALASHSIGLTAVALTFYSARLHNIPRFLFDVAQYTEFEENDISRAVSFLIRELKLRYLSPEPLFYVSQVIAEFHLPMTIENRVNRLIVQFYQAYPLFGGDFRGIIGAAIVLACGSHLRSLHLSLNMIYKTLDINEGTLRSRLRELRRLQ